MWFFQFMGSKKRLPHFFHHVRTGNTTVWLVLLWRNVWRLQMVGLCIYLQSAKQQVSQLQRSQKPAKFRESHPVAATVHVSLGSEILLLFQAEANERSKYLTCIMIFRKYFRKYLLEGRYLTSYLPPFHMSEGWNSWFNHREIVPMTFRKNFI